MKKLKYFILGLVGALSWSLYSCQNDDVQDFDDSSEQTFTVTSIPTTKGSTNGITGGLGTYKTGENAHITAIKGWSILAVRTSGSGSCGPCTQGDTEAFLDINNIHGDWTVSSVPPATKKYTITFKAGTGGTIGTPTTVTDEEGASVTGPKATANDGYSFSGWSDGSTNNPWSGTIGSTDRTVTARFVQKEVVYTFSGHLSVVNGKVEGTVTCDKYVPCEAIIDVSGGGSGSVSGYMWPGTNSCTIDTMVDIVWGPIMGVSISWNGTETARIVNNVTYN